MDRQISQDEKSGLLSNSSYNHESQPPYQRQRHAKKAVFLILLLVWLSCYTIPRILSIETPDHMKASDVKLLDFENITPSEQLEWHSCFMEPYKCARLTVPMDYHRPLNASQDNPKVHIALLMVPGKHTNPKSFSQSPLLLNPGGPGGSGTMLALAIGESMQSIVGQDQDIIGFDPRGIGATTPRADCFSYPYEDLEIAEEEDYVRGNLHRILFQTAGRAIGTVNSSSTSLRQLDVRARTIAKLCEEKDSFMGKDGIMRYVHTPSVARDMISIIDAWDEWTNSLGEDLPSDGIGGLNLEFDDERTRYQSPDTKGKLVYWGFSYGTLLGATFAAMFPDRVGRVVLDGVVDADSYVAPIWMHSIQDADTIFESFARYCYEGNSNCLLYRSGDEVADIQGRFHKVLESLKDNPLTAIDPVTKSPVIITYSDIRMLLFATLYSPIALFPVIAFLANLIYLKQGELLAQLLSPAYNQDFEPVCASKLPYWALPNEAQAAIMCSDKRYPLNETIPDLEARYEHLANSSSWADVWMTIMLGCEGWKIEAVDPPMRWDDHPAHKQKPIKTSHPLLFISNTADPVTPLKAGVKMAKKFLDAGLIEQQSEGHCSLAAPSRCTANKIGLYFLTGEVPPPPTGTEIDWSKGSWTKCKADAWPFHPYTNSELLIEDDVEKLIEPERMAVVQKMQDAFRKMPMWGSQAPLQQLLDQLIQKAQSV